MLSATPARPAQAQQPQPVVHAVLFYSPSCGHCEYVITQVLPPLSEKYGNQLQIVGFDVTHPTGQAMMYAAMDRFGLQEPGVPLLVIDDITLIGSQQIPDEFPGLIEAYLKIGGVTWPDIPGLAELLLAAAQTATAESSPTVQPGATMQTAATPAATPAAGVIGLETGPSNWQQRFNADLTANTVSVVTLFLMLAAFIWALVRLGHRRGPSIRDSRLPWLIPVLCLLGSLVAGYLAYVETTNTSAVCGPIGDCNTVQQSPYSHLFGVLSIGVFGLMGYALILIAWAWAQFGTGRTASQATLALFVLALFGTLFSMYLTFLEPFVIGATCAWCLTSAILMTILMTLTAGPAGQALRPALSWGQRGPRHARSRTSLL